MKLGFLEEFCYGIRGTKLFFAAALSFVWAMLNAGFSHIMSFLVTSTGDMQKLKVYAFAFVGYIIIWETVEYTGDILDGKIELEIENSSYVLYLGRLYMTSPNAIKDTNQGYLSGLLGTYIDHRKELFKSTIQMGMISVISLAYSVIIFGQIHPVLAMSTSFIIIGGVGIKLFSFKATKRQKKEYYKRKAETKKIFMDSVNNISTVQKLRAINFFNSQLKSGENRSEKAFMKMAVIEETFFCLYKAMMYLVLPVNLIICVRLSRLGIGINLVQAVSYISLNAVTMVHNAKYIGAAYSSINEFLISKKQLDEVTSKTDKSYTSSSIGSQFNIIQLKDVQFQYKGTGAKICIPDFSVRKGEFVVLSGESGQGKTTVLKLLSGEVHSEHLYVDGKRCYENLDPSYVAQDVEMFDMSLRNNLLLGNKATDEELIEMIYAVGMGEWLKKQKDGLDVMLGERGVKVSSGQRQRLNLIRGLLRSKEVYFLDEPTSNVDDATEDKIIEMIERKLKGKTVIIVTHRPKIKEICDKEYVFKDNCLVEKDC